MTPYCISLLQKNNIQHFKERKKEAGACIIQRLQASLAIRNCRKLYFTYLKKERTLVFGFYRIGVLSPIYPFSIAKKTMRIPIAAKARNSRMPFRPAISFRNRTYKIVFHIKIPTNTMLSSIPQMLLFQKTVKKVSLKATAIEHKSVGKKVRPQTSM